LGPIVAFALHFMVRALVFIITGLFSLIASVVAHISPLPASFSPVPGGLLFARLPPPFFALSLSTRFYHGQVPVDLILSHLALAIAILMQVVLCIQAGSGVRYYEVEGA
jgi:hypothetical protein